MAITVSRINITIPKNLVEELKKTVPRRERSKVITEALKEKIAKMKMDKSFMKLAGIWDKAGGIPFKTDADLRAWRKSLWSSTEKRFTKRTSG